MSDLHAETCRVIPIRAMQSAPEPDAAYLAERAAVVLSASGDRYAKHRAALIRAAADGNSGAAMDAIMDWVVQRLNEENAA